jgi:ABC-type branched-subunit amino acid transport system permease subunit
MEQGFLAVLIVVVSILFALALAVERAMEIIKGPLMKIKWLVADPNLLISAKVLIAVLIGWGLAAVVSYNVMSELGAPVPVAVGYLMTGLLTSTGSSFWHAILEWLKTIKEPNRASAALMTAQAAAQS